MAIDCWELQKHINIWQWEGTKEHFKTWFCTILVFQTNTQAVIAWCTRTINIDFHSVMQENCQLDFMCRILMKAGSPEVSLHFRVVIIYRPLGIKSIIICGGWNITVSYSQRTADLYRYLERRYYRENLKVVMCRKKRNVYHVKKN